ncbi:MAG: hypothetical protein Q9165_005597 [Trypethelium subeluteriae]
MTTVNIDSDIQRQDARRVLCPISPVPEDLSVPLQDKFRTEDVASDPQISVPSLLESHNTLIAPEPQAVRLEPLKTPDDGEDYELELFDALHGPIPSMATLEIAPAAPKTGRALQLPSFHLLGIAARNPDNPVLDLQVAAVDVEAGSPIVTHGDERSASTSTTVHSKVCPLASEMPQKPPSEGRREHSRDVFQSPLHQYVPTITPPVESGSIDWSARATVSLAGAESPGSATEDGNAEATQACGSTNGGANPTQPAAGRIATIIEPPQEIDQWLSHAIENFITNLDPQNHSVTSIKFLSHALPCPSATGHAFPKVIKAIQDRIPPTSVTWINVTHAVHDRFRLSDLPTSPPATPAAPLTGNDYFSSTVFDSAVSIIDYQLPHPSQQRLPTTPIPPSSPHPAVSPGSLDFSLCERYIPPASPHEFATMFSTAPGSTSLLVDRLVELSPNSGRLLFIYPTRRGAQTFMDAYLGPVLDPIIRSMVVLHNFSSNLRSRLGRMDAVDALPTFGALESQLRRLCRELSGSSSSSSSSGGGGEPSARALGSVSSLDRLRQGASFAVTYAACERVRLERGVWAREWWVKQEKRRVRDAVTAWYQTARSQMDKIPVEIIEDILSGVATKQQAIEPSEGVEVGVFVIARKG